MPFEHYIPVGQEQLRCGYTTGTCAAAAARGAAELLLRGVALSTVSIETPAGIFVETELLDFSSGPNWAACAVRKDGGDDPDATHGTLIYARVTFCKTLGVTIDGGAGIGRVTRPGLDQPVGAAAINSVPRKMIETQLLTALVGTDCAGLAVTISAPEGERLARKTFNPRLGIEGGISILGTSGIVRPMSEAALVASVQLELDMVAATGARDVVVTPGNYGEAFCRSALGLGLVHWATCSNYIGEAIDYAAGRGMRSLLLVGHLGKLVKVSAGSMNTHSRVSDGRRETLAVHTALQGGNRDTVQAVFDAPTTDAAVEILDSAGLRKAVMAAVAAALEEQLRRRTGGGMRAEALFFSNRYGILGQTSGAEELLRLHSVAEPNQTEDVI